MTDIADRSALSEADDLLPLSALQHYLYNVAVTQTHALCMTKYAHDPELYNVFFDKFKEEQFHPNLAKRFGFALGLTEEDFQDATPIYENLCHIGAGLRHKFMGSPVETRTSGFTNESMLCRYSEEFNTYLPKHYGLSDGACEFFSMHHIADQEHTKTAANFVVSHLTTPRQQRLVREIADYTVRLNIAKFEGLYQAYA